MLASKEASKELQLAFIEEMQLMMNLRHPVSSQDENSRILTFCL